jgi:hypothetical protein
MRLDANPVINKLFTRSGYVFPLVAHVTLRVHSSLDTVFKKVIREINEQKSHNFNHHYDPDKA